MIWIARGAAIVLIALAGLALGSSLEWFSFTTSFDGFSLFSSAFLWAVILAPLFWYFSRYFIGRGAHGSAHLLEDTLGRSAAPSVNQVEPSALHTLSVFGGLALLALVPPMYLICDAYFQLGEIGIGVMWVLGMLVALASFFYMIFRAVTGGLRVHPGAYAFLSAVAGMGAIYAGGHGALLISNEAYMAGGARLAGAALCIIFAIGFFLLLGRTKPGMPTLQWNALFSVDARALGVFRIFYGGLFMFDIIRRLPYVEFMYTAEGILPNKTIHDHPFSPALFSVLNSFDGAIEVSIFFHVALLFSFLFTIGYRTKLFQFLASICIISIHTKNILVENGGDQVMNLFVVWMLFLPMGIRYSVDSFRKSLRYKETSAKELNNPSLGANPRIRVWSLAVLACLFQLACIYFFNAVEKNGPVWRDGNAMYYVMQMDRQVTDIAYWMRLNLPYGAWVGMNYSTWILEALPALFIMSPIFPTVLRRAAFLMLTALHIGIAATMNVGMFSPAMICAYPILMTAPDFESWKRLLRKFAYKPITVFYDPDCGFCMACMRILKRMNHLGLLTFADRSWDGAVPDNLEALRQNSIVVWHEGADRPWTRNQALGRIVLALPFGFLVAWVFFLPGIGEGLGALYDALAKRRTQASEFVGAKACNIPTNTSITPQPEVESPALGMFRTMGWGVKETLLVLLIIFNAKQMLSSNKYIQTITKEWSTGGFKQQPWIRNFLRYPRNFQKWNMFAPNPPKGEGWIIVDACTADGRNIDPFSGKPPVFGPVDYEVGFDFGQHWRIYSKRIAKKKHKTRRDALRQYLLKRHRYMKLEKEDRITEFDVYWMYTRSPSPDEWYKPVPKDHWSHTVGRALGIEDKLTSWARHEYRYEKDSDLFQHPEFLKGNRKPRPSCYKVTGHHPFPGKKRKMKCKKGKNAVKVPKRCNRPEPAGKTSRRMKNANKNAKKKKKKSNQDSKPGVRPETRKTRPSTESSRPSGTNRLPARLPTQLRTLPPSGRPSP